MPINPATDKAARTAVLAAAASRGVTDPGVVQLVQALGRHEGGPYGMGFGAAGAGCHNWGAVHHSLPTTFPGGAVVCPPGSFFWGKEFNPATQARYGVCMRCYASAQAGANGVFGELSPKVRPMSAAALASKNAYKLASAMYRERYFGGFLKHDAGGPNDRANVRAYGDALMRHAADIARNLGEPLLVRGTPSDITLTGTIGGGGGERAPSSNSAELLALLLAAGWAVSRYHTGS